jgi:pectinesterase
MNNSDMKKLLLSIIIIVMFCFGHNKVLAQDKYEMTVAPDGSGDFKTIQQAIDASRSFPDKRIKIFVKNGVYHEKLVVPAFNNRLSLIGESAEKTIISWDDYFGKMEKGRNSTFYTYTLLVEADEFYAENLTIENTAGPVGQAVALNIRGDRCVLRNCRILGNQDTLYTDGLNSRQYFDSCYIEGTTDFIFGGSTVLFDYCTIYSKKNSFITAASTPQGKSFGYVFRNCKLSAADSISKVYLGRPWRDFARVVFMYCELGGHIIPAGWSNWSGTERDKTAYYAEYGNTGKGADPSQRVPWSHQLTKDQSAQYTLLNILAPEKPMEKPADQWVNGKY